MSGESLAAAFDRDGFVVVDALLESDALARLRSEADRLLKAAPEKGGARNAMGGSELFRTVGTAGALAALARSILGPSAMPVKLTIFDKTARAKEGPLAPGPDDHGA